MMEPVENPVSESICSFSSAVYESVTDNWPTREPYFLATGSSLPSRKLNAREQREVLELAEKALAALKFADGVFHAEFKYTSKGPRLIEINARGNDAAEAQANLDKQRARLRLEIK